VQSVKSLALDAWGYPVLGGTSTDSIYFPFKQILNAGKNDGFVARLEAL
jgi:hypothetical protein